MLLKALSWLTSMHTQIHGLVTIFPSVSMAMSCSIFLSALALVFSHYVVGICGDNIGTDQSALLALKSHVSIGSNALLHKNWSAESSVCSWVGVVCGSVSHRVVSLDISHLGINGSIPSELGNLSFLRALDLRSNGFSGAIPPSIFSSLLNLQFLYLSQNRLSGSIPSSVSNMSKLEVLVLQANALQGSIPREIGDLRYLRVLDLQTNQLSGPVPPSIFNLSFLEVMALSGNALNGSLPEGIGFNLPELQGLYLFENEFHGLIPPSLGKCSQLKIVSLSYNSFSGAIPRELGNLTQLDHLHLGANKLTGTIPAEIGNLQALEVFAAHENFLSASIPQTLFNISTLRIIQCASNGLSGNLPPNIIQGIPNVEEFNFALNNLGGSIPDSISNASKFTTLCLSYNSLTGFIPETLGNLRSLEILCLSGNNLKAKSSSSELSIITSLTNCRNLRVLTIGGNPLNKVLPTSVGNLSTNLRAFLVGRSKIRGVIPEEIGNLSSVLRINLYENELTGSIPSTVERLKSLQELYLQNNSLEGTVPNTICNLGSVGLVDLKNNQISGPVPSCIGNMTSLRYLYLDSNSFSSRLPPSLWTLEDLLVLSASSNSLSGYVPPGIGNLRVITYIDLSMNRLSGNIPTTLGRLQNLITLSLAQNELEGPIPDSFGRVLSLEMLDLSHNKLVGTIPRSLETIVYLKVFNVSFNGLSGSIPTEGPFQNFTGLSFMSNAALCGASRFEVLPCPTTQSRGRFRLILYIFLVIFSMVLISTYSAFLFMRSRLKKRAGTEKSPSSLSQDVISYLELQNITNDFSEGNLLAVGSVSSVYEGTLTDGTHAAIKIFNLKSGRSLETFDTESKLLSSLRHRNLTMFITSRATRDLEVGAIVLEYMPNGTLDRWLYSHNYSLGILQRLDIMIDVASALDYLHHDYPSPVVHCDVKPSNVLLDEDMVAHLGDFGISKILCDIQDGVLHTKTIGTVGYIAPEYGTEGAVSTKCDVYSYGIMLMETFSRRRPSDDMFTGDVTLRSWITDSFPDAILEVADSNLLNEDSENSDAKLQCLTSVMKLALHCTAKSPGARMDIRTALSVLQKLRHQFMLMSCGRSLGKCKILI